MKTILSSLLLAFSSTVFAADSLPPEFTCVDSGPSNLELAVYANFEGGPTKHDIVVYTDRQIVKFGDGWVDEKGSANLKFTDKSGTLTVDKDFSHFRNGRLTLNGVTTTLNCKFPIEGRDGGR